MLQQGHTKVYSGYKKGTLQQDQKKKGLEPSSTYFKPNQSTKSIIDIDASSIQA